MALKKQEFKDDEIPIFDEACVCKRWDYWQFRMWLASSASVVALAKKMAKSDTKTITRTISIPKAKVIKQPVQQPSKPSSNGTSLTAIKPITPQSRYESTNQLISVWKMLINARFSAVYNSVCRYQ